MLLNKALVAKVCWLLDRNKQIPYLILQPVEYYFIAFQQWQSDGLL